MYIYERKNWPHFTWDQKVVKRMLVDLHILQGRIYGRMDLMGFELKEETILQTLTQDIVKSSEIEGEILDQTQVRSSVAQRLGIEHAALETRDRNVDGVVEMVLDATQKFNKPLTKDRLWGWHASLFPTGYSGFYKIKVGAWREGHVQVVSGRLDKEIIHFEGPPANRVNHEMKAFLHWFNEENETDPLLKAALAHLWFVTIHPFSDGNGRIGRAIADLMLARSEKSTQRFYSLSSQIQIERKGYYAILEKTQKGELEITPWIVWFLSCVHSAIEKALSHLDVAMHKTKYWESLSKLSLNERQKHMINLLLESFYGKLTSTKWAKINKCSQDTAYRDILELVELGILIKNPEGGRSTSYSLSQLTCGE